MLIVMKTGRGPEDTARVRQVASDLGWSSQVVDHHGRPAVLLACESATSPPAQTIFEGLDCVEKIIAGARPALRVQRVQGSADTRVKVGTRRIGPGTMTLIAGPCAVESEEQLLPLARDLAAAGADILRGGAYKPRSNPYDFQGLGEPGLRLLARAREESGLPVVTEAVDEASLELVETYADMIQIGARNMQNFALLKRAGRSRLPVLLKRGLSARLEDLLHAAEYLMDKGNPNVVLCERGIRTFSSHSRFTLDLSILPVLRKRCHLPIMVDPSHACGIRESVAPLSRAAIAAGADGVMVEVHPDPARAFCDGPQSLLPHEFVALAADLRALAPLLAQQNEAIP